MPRLLKQIKFEIVVGSFALFQQLDSNPLGIGIFQNMFIERHLCVLFDYLFIYLCFSLHTYFETEF